MVVMTCINGSPRSMSRTGVLLDSIAHAIMARMPMERHDVALASAGTHLLSGLTRRSQTREGEAICRVVEESDLLLVASPVYRGSYSGLLKHLFDLVDRDALNGKIGLLAATGGSAMHGLVLEHQFRPLMGFFGVQTVATGIYGLEHEVEIDGRIDQGLLDRVKRAAEQAVKLLRGSCALQAC
jgi:FMN reductase